MENTNNKQGTLNPSEIVGETDTTKKIKQNVDNANLILRNLYDNSLSRMTVGQIRTEIIHEQILLRSVRYIKNEVLN